jgi:hypothetical protein
MHVCFERALPLSSSLLQRTSLLCVASPYAPHAIMMSLWVTLAAKSVNICCCVVSVINGWMRYEILLLTPYLAC